MPSAPCARGARSAPMPLGRHADRARLAPLAALRAATVRAATVRAATVLGVAVLAAAVLGTGGPAGAAGASKGTISLTSQTSWVRTATDFSLGVAVTSTAPLSDLALDLTLFSRITSRTEFDVTLGGGVDGLAVESNLQIPVTSLPRDVADGAVPLALPISAPGVPGTVPPHTPADRILQLSCDTGLCGGVYPLRVSLVDARTSQALDTFTTHVVIAPNTSYSQPLRFSFVVPLGAAPSLAPSGAPEPSRATSAGIGTIAGALAGAPGAPITVDAYGQTLVALARRDRPPDRVLLDSLDSASTTGSAELLDSPFTSVNPATLAGANLGADLAVQLDRGRRALHSTLGTSGTAGIFVATSPIGERGLGLLAQAGVTKVVVASSNLQPSGFIYTETAPFRFVGSPVEGIQSDAGLQAYLTSPGDPVLRAHQLLADLAVLYFGWPYFTQPRGVALVAPPDWTPNAVFLQTLLQGLGGNSPIVSAVSLSTLFAQVPVETTCQQSSVDGCSPPTRALAPPHLAGGAAVSAAGVSQGRAALGDLASVVPTDPGLLANMNDSILLAETAGLGAAARVAYASAPAGALRSFGSSISLPAGRIVTVTSSTAKVPIVVASTSPTPLHLVMQLSSASLTFPGSNRAQPVVLHRGNNVTVVRISAPTSGQFPLRVQLVSPSGHVVLASARFLIRSTAISGVAIGLTAGAGAVLLIWWARSVRRRRRARSSKGLHARGRRPDRAEEPVSSSAS